MSLCILAASEIDAARRKALRRCHPDAGGSRADWDRLTEALRVLGGDPR